MICNGQETVFHFLKVGDFEEWGAVIYNFKNVRRCHFL